MVLTVNMYPYLGSIYICISGEMTLTRSHLCKYGHFYNNQLYNTGPWNTVTVVPHIPTSWYMKHNTWLVCEFDNTHVSCNWLPHWAGLTYRPNVRPVWVWLVCWQWGTIGFLRTPSYLEKNILAIARGINFQEKKIKCCLFFQPKKKFKF